MEGDLFLKQLVLNAKKEVFDDIEVEIIKHYGYYFTEDIINRLKKKHLGEK